MSRQFLQGILNEYAELVGMSPVELDSHDYCCLKYEPSIFLNLQWHDASKQVICYIPCGQLPAGEHLAVYRAMLEANFFWQKTGGATLAIDHNTDSVWLIDKRLPSAFTNVNELSRYFETIISAAENWNIQLFNNNEAGTSESQSFTAPLPGPHAISPHWILG